MFAYWDTEPRLAWQTKKYYQQQRKQLSQVEFDRVHRNKWQSPVDSFVQAEWWDACADESLPELESDRIPVVIAVDAATENDCAAIVAVTRDPKYPNTDVAVRACKIFSPKFGSIILEETIGRTLIDWCMKWNVVCVAYDNYQMKNMIQNYQRGNIVFSSNEVKKYTKDELYDRAKEIKRAINRWYFQFSQHGLRSESDKMLQDKISNREISYNPDLENWDIGERLDRESLSKHIKQAGMKKQGLGYRLYKLTDASKIDAAVALSMAVYQCMSLTITNKEYNQDDLLRQLEQGQISLNEFESRLKQRRLAVKDG
jgi:phage terminase large subunit-like protein